MNHRDRNVHNKGFTMAQGYTPPVNTVGLWSTLLGKAILLIVGALFALVILKVVGLA